MEEVSKKYTKKLKQKKRQKDKKEERSAISLAHLRYYAELVLYILISADITTLMCVV